MPPIMPEPPDQPASTHETTRPPLPVRPTAGTSPLIDRIDSDVAEIHVTSAFGGRVHVQLIGNHQMPEIAVGAMAAVTIYGSGEIEYHTKDPRVAEGGGAA